MTEPAVSKKLVWDQTGERMYETGTDHGVMYPSDGEGGYEAGVVWNGLTGVSENPEGAEANDLYADNIAYASLRSAEKFKFTIEAYMYPPQFAVCDGTEEPVTGVYLGQQSRKPFGFCYRTKIGSDTHTDADAGYKLHIIYNATAAPSEKSYETINDSPDAITFSWECDSLPVPCTGFKPVSSIVIDSTKVDAEKLGDLEDLLYGTDNTDPELPDPDTVLETLGYTSGD